MRIKRIAVTGFRCFDAAGVSIELPDISVPFSIIGPNNSGKTSLLDAVLYGLASKSTTPTTFCPDDFNLKNVDQPVTIELEVDPPLRSASAYGKVVEMPILKLEIKGTAGAQSVSHYCCDVNGKKVFNAQTIKSSKKNPPSKEDVDAISERNKGGAELVYKHRSKIPVYYVSPHNLLREVAVNRFSLLGKAVDDLRTSFNDLANVMPDEDGVKKPHVGLPRAEVYQSAVSYLEAHVFQTPEYRRLVGTIESVLKEQLEVEARDIQVKFSPPEPDSFFSNLHFTVRDRPDNPALPLHRLGTGFLSMFVIALLRALVDADKGGNIFVIEEPETFLHEHFQEYAYNVLCRLAQNNQVIYTTHSKKFVNVFEPRSIIRLHPKAGGTTVVHSPEARPRLPTEIDGIWLSSPSDYPKYMRSLEPNIGNIAFSRKVVLVEGPHDLIAYRTALDSGARFGLRNIGVVCAWGKDSLIALTDLCAALQIPFYIVHDWDLTDPDIDLADEARYSDLEPAQKSQFTKNLKLARNAWNGLLHANKPHLEGVLRIPASEKSAASVFARVSGVELEVVRTTYPDLIPDSLVAFVAEPS